MKPWRMLMRREIRRDLRVIGAFTIAGLVVPFALYPLWWLATRDHPILKLESFLSIEGTLFPGMRGAIVGWTGPWNWSLIATRWMRAFAQNAAIYAVVGVVFVLVARLARKRSGRVLSSK
jgi:hypothetical protein